jgi:hypothetical protein
VHPNPLLIAIRLMTFAIVSLALRQNAIAANTAVPQIWLNMTNYNMPGGVDGPQGWNKLFVDPNAPWPEFMIHVPVVAAAGIMQVPDDVLGKSLRKIEAKTHRLRDGKSRPELGS